jgi:hypothetical protein
VLVVKARIREIDKKDSQERTTQQQLAEEKNLPKHNFHTQQQPTQKAPHQQQQKASVYIVLCAIVARFQLAG